MKGFVAPRDPSGLASLYGPPPWHFAGRSITVTRALRRGWRCRTGATTVACLGRTGGALLGT